MRARLTLQPGQQTTQQLPDEYAEILAPAPDCARRPSAGGISPASGLPGEKGLRPSPVGLRADSAPFNRGSIGAS